MNDSLVAFGMCANKITYIVLLVPPSSKSFDDKRGHCLGGSPNLASFFIQLVLWKMHGKFMRSQSQAFGKLIDLEVPVAAHLIDSSQAICVDTISTAIMFP